MKHISELLTAPTDERGLPGKHYIDDYLQIELSDNETFDALYEAKKKKYYQIKTQEYYKRINSSNAWSGIDADKLLTRFTLRLTKSITTPPTDKSLHLLNELTNYFLNEQGKYSLNKGLLLLGNVGTGKTKIAQAIAYNPRYQYEYTTAKNLSECYEIGDDHWHHYITPNNAFIIDDIGTEKHAQQDYKKGLVESVSEFILSRYDTNSLSNVVITTNLNADAIGNRYGERVRDRIREAFNVIIFDGASLRK